MSNNIYGGGASIIGPLSTAGTVTLTGGGYNNFPPKCQSIQITLTPANGGTIVSIKHNASSMFSMDHDSDLYIVEQEKNVDEELGKILTMSRLKLKGDRND